MYFWFKDLLLFHYGAYTDMYLLVIFSSLTFLGGLLPCRTFSVFLLVLGRCIINTYEPRHEKTNVLHMRKQRRRPASR